MPGCLPEVEPQHAETLAEAKEILMAQLEELEINSSDDSLAEVYNLIAEAVNGWNGPDAVNGPDGDPYVYSIVASTG
jgi:hypothetical protein